MSKLKRRKVLEVIQPVDGGSAVHMRQLLSGLDLEQFDVHLAAPENSDYRGICESRGIHYHVINLQRTRNPLTDLPPFISLLRLCIQQKFDVVHAHCTKAGLLGRFVARLVGVRIIYTPHGFIYSQPSPRIFQLVYYWLERLTLPLVHKVIFVSPSEAKVALGDKVLPQRRAVVIANGVNTDIPQRKPDKRPAIIMVSRFEEPKKPEELLKAAPLILQKYPTVEFVVIGDGSKRGLLEQLVADLGITSQVEMLGFRSDVAQQFARGVMAVLCSSSEGLPYVVLEAMASSRPVIGSRVKGVVDIIHEGKNGLLYELGNIQDLADKILTLLDNPRMAEAYGQNGRDMVLASYSTQRMLDDIQQLYRSRT